MTEKRPVGRPTKYKDEYVAQAYSLALLGLTDEEMAKVFDVDVSTINEWKLVHPEFSESVKEGKELADARVTQSLYRRAMGYSHEAQKIFNDQGAPLVVDYTEHYPPDTTACIFWLKNRQRDKWRDRVDTTIASPTDGPVEIVHSASKEAMDALRAKVDQAK